MGGDALALFLLTSLILVSVFGARAYLQRRSSGPSLPSLPRPSTPSTSSFPSTSSMQPGMRPDLPFSLTAPSAAEPPAPPRPEHRAALTAARDQAVLLRRDFPPRPSARNRWGGVPEAARGFTWPFSVTPEGEERALHLLLQLDCSAIPDEGRLGLMPESGRLYFFLDLDWGRHWKWSVRYEAGDPDEFVPAKVPAYLPHAYAAREMWDWPRRDDDWPRLLPEWSVEPVLVRAPGGPRRVEEATGPDHDFWPGGLDVGRAVERVEGAVAPWRTYRNTYDEEGGLVRPFVGFPHDWQAVRITLGYVDRWLRRPGRDLGPEALVSLRGGLDAWSARAYAADPWDALAPADSDAVWELLAEHHEVSRYALSEAVNVSIEATLSGSPHAGTVLPAEAVDLVRIRHALAYRGEDDRLQVQSNTARMLCAPSFVQGDAEHRVGEWLLLLELAESRPIGHLFGEGVYQFWIRPADLEARRFDLVELTASAY